MPSGVAALGHLDPDLQVFAAAAFLEIGWDRPLSIALASVWISRGGGPGCTLAQASLYIEVEVP